MVEVTMEAERIKCFNKERPMRSACPITLYLTVATLVAVLSPAAFSAEESHLEPRQVYIVPFSHLDLYWACTQEECLSRGNYIISRAIQLAKLHPEYRYLLETEVFVSNFVDSHRGSAELEDFKQLVKEGRIEIAPLWAAIYQNQTRAEALVRNLTYGKRYAREVFGVDPKVAHLADIPGFTRQYPQLLSKAAIPYMVMTRMGPRDISLFHWKAPDGSSVLVWNTIKGYGWGVDAGLHLNLDHDHLEGIANDLKSVEATTNAPIYMGWGTDLYAPTDKLIENIGVLNQQLSPIHFRLSTAEEYFGSAAATNGIPEIAGEIPSSWANLTTSLVPLWPPAMSATDTLLSAEKFAAINYSLGYAAYPDKALESLWKDSLKSLDHNNDGQGGPIGDERKLGYAHAASLGAGQILRDSLRNIAERVQVQWPRSTPIVVFNPLGWTRDDVVEAHVTLFGDVATNEIDDYKKGMRLIDAQGASVPFQLEQYTDGSSRSLDLLFIARGVGSVGYTTYYLVPANEQETFSNASDLKIDTDNDAKLNNKHAIGSDILENAYYRISVERATGRVEIFDKDLKRTVSKGLEIVATEERGGDDQNIILPSGRTIIDVVDAVEVEENGPVRTILCIHGNIAGIPIVQRIGLYRDIKKIDIEDTIDWTPGRSMNIEQLIPVMQPEAEVRNGVPFGTAGARDVMLKSGPRGDDEVSPEIWKGWRQIQDWVFAGTKEWGFTLSADHQLVELGNSVIRADMLRGTRFNPTTTIRNGQTVLDYRPSAGKYVFRYSFTSGKGDWSSGRSWRAGMAFSTPLIAVSSANTFSEKPLPPENSFLSFDTDNVVFTAMKKADDGETIVVRGFEIQGNRAESRLRFFGEEPSLRLANLLEEDLASGEGKTLSIQPFEIFTLKVPVPSSLRGATVRREEGSGASGVCRRDDDEAIVTRQ
jgi:alpha-mannosidase